MKPLCLLTFGKHYGFIMAKRSKGKSTDHEVFRDSDFIGMDPRMQSQLSDSLNTLSERVTSAMKALSEVPRAADKSRSADTSSAEEKPGAAAPVPRGSGPDGSGGTAA
jgi:hypothetical protein